MISVINDIKFLEQPLCVIGEEIARANGLETGGVLIGAVNGNILTVTKASGPGTQAIHEQTYFKADPNFADMFIDVEVANSNNKYRYIGEWHSHPEVIPGASDVDLNSLREIAESSEDFVLMVIVGAIGFTINKFPTQHLSILKYKGDKSFYKF